ncbi:hypothetical protein [Streptomyces sp. CRN 30]|uniref:hypothetical protein n=1 Tax=Streptomyces sp. CRN 30 TaxID=3075613 RepID=UPI002A8025CC|nr:hypothetical protein [Streptomyces sp. CRN 30]
MTSPEPAEPDGESGVRIGDVTHSTFAVGRHARAESHHGGDRRPGPADEELLAAVRALRADLARVRQDDRTRQLDAALADTEDDIARTGTAEEGRRQRLRELLADAQAVVSLFTSAAAVGGLLGL